MRFEVSPLARELQPHIEAATQRFGAEVSLGSHFRLLGAGSPLDLTVQTDDGIPITARSARLRSALAAGQPNLVIQLASTSGVLGRARVSLGWSIGAALRNAIRAIPSLCEQAAHCLTQNLVLPPLPDQPAAAGARLPSGRAFLRESCYRAGLAPAARDWQIAISTDPPETLLRSDRLTKFTQVPSPFGNAFRADPFVLVHQGRTWIFSERVGRFRGQGVIVAAELEDNRLIDQRVVLTGRHVAFPRLINIGGRWVCTADSLDHRNPVYTCDAPGEPWRPLDRWSLPTDITDPVLVETAGGLLTLFGTDRSLCSAGAVVCFQARGLGDPWQRAAVPFMYDVQAGRSGGYADSEMRITQDCSRTYGWRLGITPTRGLDGSLESKAPENMLIQGAPRPHGMHTLNWSDDGPIVIDTWRHRPDARALWWRWAERRALRN